MSDSAEVLVRRLKDGQQLHLFGVKCTEWLLDQANPGDDGGELFTESRARALLRAGDVVDDVTLRDFANLIHLTPVERVALYDLLKDSKLSSRSAISGLIELSSGDEEQNIQWLTLITAAYALEKEYPLNQLDPSSPPAPYSPAGQVVRKSAQFIRRQVQRSVTDRDKIDRRLLAPISSEGSETPSLDELRPSGEQVAPLPPHYRPPVPERYPEVSREVLQVTEADRPDDSPIQIGDPLVITEEELETSNMANDQPVRMPPIRITQDQITPEAQLPPSPMPNAAVVIPTSTTEPKPSLTIALRQMFGQEELTSTKLRILVQQYPDGPGVYGLQVRVRCKGIKSYVAGTTDRDGKFVCELPVRVHSGLTYDVDVTWPRDTGGDVERKSITLNADRTEFALPFYRRSSPEVDRE